MATYRTICTTRDIPEGQARMFVVGDMMFGIFNIGGEFFALDNRCPHAGASLAHGYIEGDTVACRIHHWRFRIRDGKHLDTNRSEKCARTFPLRIVGDEIQVAW